MNSNVKTAIFWVVLVCIAVLLWTVVKTNTGRQVSELSFTDFIKQVEAGRVVEVTIAGTEVSGKLQGNAEIRTVIPPGYDKVYDLLTEKNVVTRIKEPSSGNWVTILVNAVPFVLLLAFWIFMMRQMQSGGNKALSFGKSRARMHSSQQKKVTFKDVAGVEEAKEELQEIIEFLREPQKFQKLGGRIPKGVLLIGPPGTGKTLLARAIAGEANVPFFSISGSDFVEMFVGVGASRVRDLFEQGKKNAPCIIFIDEIDAVGRHRGAGLGGGHDEREQTLNQLLVEMDGFESNEGVILVAATNRPDVLDPALLRPGRFDRRVVVSLPDVKGREQILKVHTRKTPLADDVDLSIIARGTPGFAGADLANLVNEAALLAARQNRKVVTMVDFELAKDKVLMGAERRSMMLTEEDRKVTAYHEAGHALVAALLPDADPLHKVTIIPRGRALGVTMQLPTGDVLNRTKAQLEARLTVAMAGRIGEMRFTNQLSTGARNDIEQATELARAMVCDFGMSDLGPLSFGRKEEQIFLGREIAQHRDYSEATAIKIDEEIRRLVDNAHKRAAALIEQYDWALEEIVRTLLERESIDGTEVKAILERGPVKAQAEPPAAQAEPAAVAAAEETQEVLRPEARPLTPGLIDGEHPQPA
jgi:cell division protease FtsH